MKFFKFNLTLIFLILVPGFCYATHTVTPLKINFDKNKQNNIITLTNNSDKTLYFSFDYGEKKDGKIVDISDKGYFRAVPGKFILKSGETKTTNVFIKNYRSVPKGQYYLHFTPEPRKMEAKSNKGETKFLCNVRFRYAIIATVE